MLPDPGDQKALLRARLRSTRDALPAARRSAGSRGVCERLLKVPEVAGARVLAAFLPRGGEFDIVAALAELRAGGRVLALPWVDAGELHLGVVDDLNLDTAPGWRGVREPVPDQRQPLPVAEVDVVIVPGLGYDAAGNRLGQGGGHYDRLLRGRRPGVAAVAVAFAEQLVDRVPTQDHDVPVEVIVTDDEVLRPGDVRPA
jgi:5-formyltetrahydrofolate cyclo-ligase